MQTRSRWVKTAAVLIFVFTATPLAANDTTTIGSTSLLQFWRSIFARPDAAGLSQTIAAPPNRLALGQQLFADTRLSGDNDRACVSCHDPDRGYTDGRKRALGADGEPLARNTPTLFNTAWGQSFNWDGSAATLKEQALGPLLHPNELGGNFPDIVARLSADKSLSEDFAAAFPQNPGISKDSILDALDAFVRSIIAPTTRFDRWISGDGDALSVSEKSGFSLFVGKAGCVACHVGWRFTDDRFHDIGLKTDKPVIDKTIAGKKGIMAFKTPTLRAVSITQPYMHDGSLDSLNEVIDHYSKHVKKRKGLSELLPAKIDLTEEEKTSLIAFLKTL